MERLADSQYRSLYLEEQIRCMIKGGSTHEQILDFLIVIYNYYKEDYTEEQLMEDILIQQEIINEQGGNKNKRNIQQELENLVDFRGNGIITLTDFYIDLKLDMPQEKQACRVAINRLVSRGKLEKVESGRTGTYRTIKGDPDITRFISGEGRKFPVKLPFELDNMCNIHPKSIIVIAGSKSSGKTAVLLEIAKTNQHRVPVVYLNSDMGDEEYTERMKKMGFTCQEDVKFQIYNRSHDFHDLITEEKRIFIIDFLEVHDNFFEIGKPIKQIWDKLKDGIAIIAIQMKSGGTIGRGGDFSKEKARLYLTMDYVPEFRCTKIRIEEAKSPGAAFKDGLRGWNRKIKIIDGCQFSPMEAWHE